MGHATEYATEPAARHASLAWASARLEAAGDGHPETVVLVKARPWSTVWRLRTPRRTVYLKAAGPGFEREAALLPDLARLAPDVLPGVCASEPDAGWLLLDHAGSSLRDDLQADASRGLHLLADALRDYAALQVKTAERATLRGNCADARLSILPDRLSALLGDRPLLDAAAVTAADLSAFAAAPTMCRALCAELAAFGLPDTIDHGDLHANNIMVREGAARLIDWGDAAFGHPFASFAITLDTTRETLGTVFDETPLREAYLRPWQHVAPDMSTEDLGRALELAAALRPVYGALLWSRGYHAMTGQDQALAAGWVATWLRRFAARDELRTSANTSES